MKVLSIEVRKWEGRILIPIADTFKLTNDNLREYVAATQIPPCPKAGAKVNYVFVADYVRGKGIDYSTALTLKPKAIFPNGIYR